MHFKVSLFPLLRISIHAVIREWFHPTAEECLLTELRSGEDCTMLDRTVFGPTGVGFAIVGVSTAECSHHAPESSKSE